MRRYSDSIRGPAGREVQIHLGSKERFAGKSPRSLDRPKWCLARFGNWKQGNCPSGYHREPDVIVDSCVGDECIPDYPEVAENPLEILEHAEVSTCEMARKIDFRGHLRHGFSSYGPRRLSTACHMSDGNIGRWKDRGQPLA